MKRLVHHTKRALRITSGIVLCVVGLFFMIPGVPGPGFVLVFLGLSILAVDFVWAHRLKTHLKTHADRIVDKVRGKSPKSEPVEKN
jgi:uncharacterized protein (TIGR02611 family)